jgi:hypothetical protein
MSWIRNVCRTPIANRRWPVKSSGYFRFSASQPQLPPPGPFSRFQKVQITRKRYELDDKCLQNTIKMPRSAYRMVKLLPLCGILMGFLLACDFMTSKSAIISRTLRAGQETSIEYDYETEAGVSMGQVYSARW